MATLEPRRILLVNQTCYPDEASTAQHLTELAAALAGRGHQVRVIASRRAYGDPTRVHPSQEEHAGFTLRRVGGSGLGKRARWRRVLDSLSFMAALAWALLTEPRPDLLVSLTSPPLLPVLAAAAARLRRCRFVYWAMDLNPEEAIALGYLDADSALARLLLAAAGWALRQTDTVIALDRSMAAHVERFGVPPGRIAVLAPWTHTTGGGEPGPHNRFREKYQLGDAFIVMYSGNHSPCHPLDTLLEAALALREEPELVFCFVGGGNAKQQVRAFRDLHQLASIRDLPYQPLEELASSLSAADLQVVVMGDAFVGIVHPCKIYGVLAVDAPVLYIGPRQSHIGNILEDPRAAGSVVAHGDVTGCVEAILEARRLRRRSRGHEIIAERFEPQGLIDEMVGVVEGAESAPGERSRAAHA